jgi:hypothetical protein
MFKQFLSSLLSSLASGRAPPGPQALERLQALRERPLPPELAVAPPRPDVWGERGYLSQPRYQSQYKPLLIRGFATWGFVYHYESSADTDGYDFSASYAWFDAEGNLQTRHLKDGYDGMHAALSRGQGTMVLDMDAELGKDVELVILHDLRTGEHLPYKALRTQSEPPPPPPPPHPLSQGDWAPYAKDGQYIHPYPPGRDPRELSGTFELEWSISGKTRSARLVRPAEPEPEVLFTVQRAGSSNREWTVTRPGKEEPLLRAIHDPAEGFTASFRIVDAQDNAVGTVTEKAGRVRIAASLLKRNFYTSVEARKGKRVLLEQMQEVLTLDKTDDKDRDKVVLHSPLFRSPFELLILGLVVVRHPPRPSK